jgi:hypothetical protein
MIYRGPSLSAAVVFLDYWIAWSGTFILRLNCSVIWLTAYIYIPSRSTFKFFFAALYTRNWGVGESSDGSTSSQFGKGDSSSVFSSIGDSIAVIVSFLADYPNPKLDLAI